MLHTHTDACYCVCQTNGIFRLEMSIYWGECDELMRWRRNLLDNLFTNNGPITIIEIPLWKTFFFLFSALWVCSSFLFFFFFPFSPSQCICVIVVRKLQRNYVIKKSSYCDEWCYQYHRRWDSLPLSSSWIIPWAVLMDQATVCGNASMLWPSIKQRRK